MKFRDLGDGRAFHVHGERAESHERVSESLTKVSPLAKRPKRT